MLCTMLFPKTTKMQFNVFSASSYTLLQINFSWALESRGKVQISLWFKLSRGMLFLKTGVILATFKQSAKLEVPIDWLVQVFKYQINNDIFKRISPVFHYELPYFFKIMNDFFDFISCYVSKSENDVVSEFFLIILQLQWFSKIWSLIVSIFFKCFLSLCSFHWNKVTFSTTDPK